MKHKRRRKLFIIYLAWVLGLCDRPGIKRDTHMYSLKTPGTLKEKLKANRSNSHTGSGEAYWDSVVRVVESHYGKKA